MADETKPPAAPVTPAAEPPVVNGAPPQEIIELNTRLDETIKKLTESEALALVRGKLSEANAQTVNLQKFLDDHKAELTTLQEWKTNSMKELETLRLGHEGAVTRFATLTRESNPLIPPELITGKTTEEIDKSLEVARAMVDRIKAGLAEDASKTRVPAGNPARSVDVSQMTPFEKIKHALNPIK